MAQILALSVLCCCSVIAVGVCLRDAVLAARSRSGAASSEETTDTEAGEIIY
jgi:hypothetical protein